MTIRHSCDDLTNVTVDYGTVEIDTVDKVEGLGSILWTIPATARSDFLGFNFPTALDLSNEPIIKLPIKPADGTMQIEVGIIAGADWPSYTTIIPPPASGQWNEVKVDLRTLTPADPTIPPQPDLTMVRRFVIRLTNLYVATTCKVDAIESLSDVVPGHTLTINSTPITGVPFTINGSQYNTPFTDTLAEGLYSVEMPANLVVGEDNYQFVQWEDGSTNLTRTINLLAEMTIAATYEFVAPITHSLSVNSNPVTGIPFKIIKEGIGTSYVTPWSGSLEEGVYDVEMPSNVIVGTDTYTFVQWEDLSTNPTRRINLTVDTAIEATYELVTPPPGKGYLEIHCFYNGTEVDASGTILETGQQFNTGLTGITIEVDPGTYNVQLTYNSDTKIETADVVEGQTIRLDFQFVAPTPPCFIATVAFGSPLSSQLNVLRDFRDRCLPAEIVNVYYAIGPYLAQLIKRRRVIKRYVKEAFNVFVKLYRRG